MGSKHYSTYLPVLGVFRELHKVNCFVFLFEVFASQIIKTDIQEGLAKLEGYHVQSHVNVCQIFAGQKIVLDETLSVISKEVSLDIHFDRIWKNQIGRLDAQFHF